MMKVSIKTVVLGAIILAGCQRRPPAADSSVAVKPDAPTPATTATPEVPFYELSPQRFRDKWLTFIKDGRYRMAQTKEVAGMPYHYSFSNDVLVIVVDQTLNDDSRLKRLL